MIKGFITNAAMLICFCLFVYQIFKGEEVTPDSPYLIRIMFGIITGLAGIVLILFSVMLTPTFILDFRQIAIIVAACYGGWLPPIITGVVIGVFRLFYLGINHMAIVGSIAAQVLAIGCSLISLLPFKMKHKWAIMTAYCIFTASVVFNILIVDLVQFKQIVFYYAAGLIILSLIAYHFSEKLILMNRIMKSLKEDSAKDFLTGLNNVRSFDKSYNSILQAAIEKKQQLSVLVLDIDYFKMVNDVYGHQAGDNVLKEFSDLLVKTCRKFDIISRNGGDEFSVLLVDCPPSKAYDIGERIRKVVEEHSFMLPDKSTINITLSIGIVTFPDMTLNKDEILKLADNALYHAKNTGRNKVCIVESIYT